MSGPWDRDLDADLDVIASSGYSVVLSVSAENSKSCKLRVSLNLQFKTTVWNG